MLLDNSVKVMPIAGALGAELTGVDLAHRPRRRDGRRRSGAPGSSTSSCSSATRSSRLDAVPRVRAPDRRAGRVSVREGDGRLPRDHHGGEAAARDRELRRHLAQRHRVPGAPADGDDARCARGPAVRRRHAVRQHVRRVRRTVAAACSACSTGCARCTAPRWPTCRRRARTASATVGDGEATRVSSPSIPSSARTPRPGARRSTSTSRTPRASRT